MKEMFSDFMGIMSDFEDTLLELRTYSALNDLLEHSPRADVIDCEVREMAKSYMASFIEQQVLSLDILKKRLSRFHSEFREMAQVSVADGQGDVVVALGMDRATAR